MDITVLAYLEPDEKEPDVVVQQVAAGLAESGHKTSILTIRHDLNELIDGLEGAQAAARLQPRRIVRRRHHGRGHRRRRRARSACRSRTRAAGPARSSCKRTRRSRRSCLAFEGIRYPDFATFPADANFETGGNLRMPLFVKPLRMDASIGIDEKSLVRNTQQMMERVLYIQRTFGDAALAEEYIEGREFYVGVMGNGELVAFPPIEMDFSGLKEGSLKVMDNRRSSTRRASASTAPRPSSRRSSPSSRPSCKRPRSMPTARCASAITAASICGSRRRARSTSSRSTRAAISSSRASSRRPRRRTAFRIRSSSTRIAELAVERWKHRSRAQKRRKKARSAAAATG